MNNGDTNLNNGNNGQVKTKVVQINTQNNSSNVDKNIIRTTNQSHDLSKLSNYHDPDKFKALNNSIQGDINSKGKNLLVTFVTIACFILIGIVAFNAVNIGKKIVDYFTPTEVDYIKEMAYKITDTTKTRILQSDNMYFVIFPTVGRKNTKYIVKLTVNPESLNSKMESFNYNNEMNLFTFYGANYNIIKDGVTYNGLIYDLKENIVPSIYKFENNDELSLIILVKLNNKDVAIYFKNVNGKVENITSFYINTDESIKINDNLVFNKDNGALFLGENKFTKI